MAKLRLDGREYELPDSDDWTTGELSEAEHALGVSFGEKSQGDAMAITFYIAVRRAMSATEMPPVILADRVKRIPMKDLLAEEEENPPAEAGTNPASHEDQPTTGPRLLAASE